MAATPLKLLLIAAGIGMLAMIAVSHQREIAQHDPRLLTGADGVVMLGASWCGYCHRLKAGLDRAKVPYVELDVEDGAAGERAFRALGGRGVPVTVVGQDVVHGYDTQRLVELIDARGYRLELN